MHTRPNHQTYWVEPGRLLAGEYPGAPSPAAARAKLRPFLQAGVTDFIDLTESHELEPYEALLHEEATALGVTARYDRFPVRDVSVPRHPDEMRGILNAIDSALDAGRVAYVHCWGGIGRTGTVVGCYLVRRGRTGDEALAELATLWKGVAKSRRCPRSPETAEQVRYVLDWSRHV